MVVVSLGKTFMLISHWSQAVYLLGWPNLKKLATRTPKRVLCIGMFGQVQIAWSLRMNVDKWLAHLRNVAMHTSLQTKSDQFCINLGPYNGHNHSYLNERSFTFHICIFIQHACSKHFWSLRQHNFKVVTLKNLCKLYGIFGVLLFNFNLYFKDES